MFVSSRIVGLLRSAVFTFSLAVIIAVGALSATWADAQEARAQLRPATGTLEIGGDVPRPVTLAVGDLRGLPRTSVTLTQGDLSSVYEGVALTELLGRAGADTGAALRGPNLAAYILISARDGYQVVFSVSEVDADFTEAGVLVADAVDGHPLPDDQGPLRLIVPMDRRPARSVRMVERIDVIKLRK
jgi:DMSO/TMAO reductase YedYZ molybdopterin-dependent catalytic subunit